MLRVHIVPGWAEGNWHFKQLSKAFSSDFKLEHDSKDADIIIAHSSGCYHLPDTKDRKLVVILDPPYWPGRSIASRIFQHMVLDASKQIKLYGLWFWLRLRAWNVFYIVIEPWRHIKIWRSLKRAFAISAKADRSLVIWDREDAYCGPEISVLSKKSGVPFVVANRLHEDCWRFPEIYIDILKDELSSKR